MSEIILKIRSSITIENKPKLLFLLLITKSSGYMIYYITGGERSGKSAYGEQLALSMSNTPKYVATSRIWDKEYHHRITRHKERRDKRWVTIEEEKAIANVIIDGDVALIDCVTLWLTNLFMEYNSDAVLAFTEAKKIFCALLEVEATLIMVSNEIGMGGHAQTAVGRKFTELQGWINQYIAVHADKAIFMVSGIPLTLK